MDVMVYAVAHSDEKVRSLSRSGGIFTAVSDYILNKNGIVYGCIMDGNYNAIHSRANDKDSRNQMRGSKYIQSKIGDSYIQAKKDLDNGKDVLFTGTSCQIAGLIKYLGRPYEKLLTIDIVCHGVPSDVVWSEYLKWIEQKKQKTIKSVIFRDKEQFGWRAHKETFVFYDESTYSSDVFKALFYGHNILRPSCYECKYKSITHPADITIADYWGIETAAPEFDDNKGVSLVLVNTQKGNEIFQAVKPEIRWKKTRIEDSMQQPLIAPFPKPLNREKFWQEFSERGMEYVAKKYTDYGIINRIRHSIGRLKRRVLKQK